MNANLTSFEHPSITIDELEPHLKLAWECGRSLFVIGDFGVGKTTVVENFALKHSARFVPMVASMMDRLDLAGLPYGDKKTKTTKNFPAETISELSKEKNPGGPSSILYLNEFNAAPDSVQPTFLRLIGERKVGSLSIRDNVLIVADGNPSTTSRLSRDLPEPSRRRFNWVMVRSSARVWCDYAAQTGVNPLVPAFLSQQSKFFYTFDPTKKHHLCYACAASWERLSKDLPAATKLMGAESEAFQKWVCGVVGVEAGYQFTTFLRHRESLPDVFQFLSKPSIEKVPKEPDALWVFLASVAQAVVDSPSSQLERGVKFTTMLFRANMIEPAVYLIRYLSKNSNVGGLLWESKSSEDLMSEIMKRPDLVQALMQRSTGKS
jgi:hypothetical protein